MAKKQSKKKRKPKKTGNSVNLDKIEKKPSKKESSSNSSDSPDTDWIDYTVRIRKPIGDLSQADLRVLGEDLGYGTAGKSLTQLKNRLKEKKKQIDNPKLKKSSDLDHVILENNPEYSLIEIRDEGEFLFPSGQKIKQSVSLTESNPDPIVKTEVRGSVEDGVIGLHSETVSGKKINSQFSIIPEIPTDSYTVPSKSPSNSPSSTIMNKVEKTKFIAKYNKRSIEKNSTIAMVGARGVTKEHDSSFTVKKGEKPYEWRVGVPKKVKIADYSDKKKIIITEKSEIAKVLQEMNHGYSVHNLGGNPFAPIIRETFSKNEPVRKGKKVIHWRVDKRDGEFVFPLVDSNAEVVIIGDEDYLGQYIAYHLSQLISSPNITMYNVESTSKEFLQELINNSHPEYAFNFNKAIGASWYIESQAEIGGSVTNYLVGSGSIFDTFTEDLRNKESYSSWKTRTKYFPAGNFSIDDQKIAILAKALEEEMKSNSRLTATIKTELGIQAVEAEIPSGVSNVNTFIEQTAIKDLNVKNTDQTTMILMNNLDMSSNQAEQLINRLASQDIISYPRTEYEGISPKENVKAEELVDIWLSYIPKTELSNYSRTEIIKGIKRIQKQTPELPRSGIIVLEKSDFKANTLERKAIESIAKANIWSALGYYEIEGDLIVEDEKTGSQLGSTTVTVISNTPHIAGEVVDVQIERKQGMSDKEMFMFLSDEKRPLGTVATRTNTLKSLENYGFLLKSTKGEYKLDDRARLTVIMAEKVDPSLTSGDFTQRLKELREIISLDPSRYNELKEVLYSDLERMYKRFKDKSLHEEVEQEFNRKSEQADQARLIKEALHHDKVEIRDEVA